MSQYQGAKADETKLGNLTNTILRQLQRDIIRKSQIRASQVGRIRFLQRCRMRATQISQISTLEPEQIRILLIDRIKIHQKGRVSAYRGSRVGVLLRNWARMLLRGRVSRPRESQLSMIQERLRESLEKHDQNKELFDNLMILATCTVWSFQVYFQLGNVLLIDGYYNPNNIENFDNLFVINRNIDGKIGVG